ncbi:hypothetical protein RhiirA1_482543 [Rhizophagus irregularis]|uniref:Uncharacterized protein n=1 Tax=Rhizophagus irregularis TaxID=588596 RepID=A0A2N0QLP2_9GLOM|nr:hypothetical protein RhiirA1_482543 [Rhizophagus irregularis]
MKKRRDINIEKANQLMKKSKNHSNKEVAESADKEVVVVNKKSSDDDDDDNDDDDDVDKMEDHKKPEKSRGEVFNELITKIFKIKIHSNEAKNYLEKTQKFFIDFKNKFNQIILTSVEEFKKIRKNRISTGSLSQKELIDYVDEKFVQKILSQQLVAVNISELIRNGGFDILVDFIRETFKVEKFCPPLKN